MTPINWLGYLEVPDVNVDIGKNFYHAYCAPKNVFVEKDLNSWDPKILGPCNYLQSFNVAALIKECGTENHYPLLMFQNGI